MRTVCIYTKQDPESARISFDCVESGEKFGIRVEQFPAVWWEDMHLVHERYGLTCHYTPVAGRKTDFVKKTMPRVRIANGTTHYLLYLWAAENGKPIHILEHDAIFVGEPPEAVDGVIQTSSHKHCQMDADLLGGCCRANKRRQHEPDWVYDPSWELEEGVIPHPLNATNGTSGYIISPESAEKMVAYVHSEGIANADRLRAAHAGNIYLQVPQSVICTSEIQSTRL